MRIVLREKKKLNEADDKTKKTVEISAMDFLKLTTDPETRMMLIERRKNDLKTGSGVGEFSAAKGYASMPYLVANSVGKVTEHEGRNRALAILQPKMELFKTKAKKLYDQYEFFKPDKFNNPGGKMRVEIKSLERNVNAVDFLSSQYGETAHISLETAKPINMEFTLEDPIGIGDQELVYSDLIHKAGEKFPNGKIRDVDYIAKSAKKDSLLLFNKVYSDMYAYLRKQKGRGDDYYNHNEVADATDEIINRLYDITDDKGPLEFKMGRGNWFHAQYAREPVGDIIIKKK